MSFYFKVSSLVYYKFLNYFKLNYSTNHRFIILNYILGYSRFFYFILS